MPTALSGAIFIQMEQRPLCLCQCCRGGTSVPGQEHGSSPPYRAERGDRQEQITPTSRGGASGMGDKKHKREEKKRSQTELKPDRINIIKVFSIVRWGLG